MLCRGRKSGILKTTMRDMWHRDSLRGWASLRSSTDIYLRPELRNDRHRALWLRQDCIVAMRLFTAFSQSYPLTIRLFLQIESRSDRVLVWVIPHLQHTLVSAVASMSGNPRPVSRKLLRLHQTSGLLSSMLVRRAFQCLNSWMTCCRVCPTANRQRELRDRCISD